ncbi:MAG TPA: TolC family protein [Pyrinomonadaceae bacterium]
MRRENRKSKPTPRQKRRLSVIFLLFGLIFNFGGAQVSLGQNQTAQKILTLNEAIDLALKQASAYKTAQINERIVEEDINQARAAFYPRITAQPNFIYTSPSLARTNGVREPSFLGADAITVYQGLINASGEIDTSGRLKATLLRNRALLESARAGSEIARRDLIQAVSDAYFNLALSETKRSGAEMNLEAALEFENNTKLQLEAGEIAPVDLVRARLQTATRRDELEQAKTEEIVNADSLKFIIGYDFTVSISTESLLVQMPNDMEIEGYVENAVNTRPEFAQFEADRRAAEQDLKIAKTERRPQFTYSVSGGFISDKLTPIRLKDTLGVQASVGMTIPIFDKGAKSREAQAQLKIQQAENTRILAERQFAQAFHTARTQAIAARRRIREIGATIADAEQNLRASAARYQAGEAPIAEVTDAQNLLIAQRQLLYQAIFDYQTARSRLLRAIGQ